MKKFAFIGAGSLKFTSRCITDLLLFPAFNECEFALMDTNKKNLDNIVRVIEKILAEMGYADKCKITPTMDRAEALKGADGVLCTVFNGDVDIWQHDILIPKKYGVDINVGDTRSVSGIFRALRNIPLMLDICADIEKYCPNAVFLNYTNPMSMLCGAMQKYSNVEVTGLCHSVQGTIGMLAEWLDVPKNEIVYKCMGINHQAFYTVLRHNNTDLYPRLRELIMNNEEVYNRDQVRNEMFLKLGYYVTESSGHNSEYNQWFRKRDDLIEKYCTHSTNWNPGLHAFSLDMRRERKADPDKQYNDFLAKPFEAIKSYEWAADIFNARIGDGKPFVFNGNVINHGSIPNLPEDACVEIPVVADKMGFKATVAGKLPDHLAVLANTTARIENLAIEAAMKKSRDLVYYAVYNDPLSSAVCSLDEIKRMCDELFEVNKDFLPEYK